MRPNSYFPADLVRFTEEILNEKLHFYAVWQNDKCNTFLDILFFKTKLNTLFCCKYYLCKV